MDQWVVEPKYEEAYPMHNGRARVKLNGQYGFINQKGLEVIPAIYKNARDFSHGLAPVKTGDNWYYINTQQKVKLKGNYKNAYAFNQNGKATVQIQDKYVLMNAHGNILKELKKEKEEH